MGLREDRIFAELGVTHADTGEVDAVFIIVMAEGTGIKAEVLGPTTPPFRTTARNPGK
jgi:hypothetical protein